MINYLKKLALAIALFICCYSVNASIKITGEIFNLHKLADGYYYQPISGFYNTYYNPQEISFSNHNSFNLIIDNNVEGFLVINFPNIRVKIFVAKDDSINLKIIYKETSGSSLKIDSLIIRGSNAKGQIAYNDIASMVSNQQFLAKSLFLYDYNNSAEKFLDRYFVLADSLLQPFKTLYKKGKISKRFYESINSDITGSLTVSIFNYFGILIQQSENEAKHNHNEIFSKSIDLNKELYSIHNFNLVKKTIYKKCNPLDTNYLKSALAFYLTGEYFHDISTHGFDYKCPLYDSNFSFLNGKDSLLGYMRGRILELFWQKSLYWSIVDGTNDSIISKSFSMFKIYFPNSEFTSYLNERLADITHGEFDVTKGAVLYLDTEKNTTLDEIIKNNFKDQYVFVDLWASWCTPCIQEFAQNRKLEHFLDSKGIKSLYISLDELNNKIKWRSLVEKEKLRGYNILVSEVLLQEIKDKIYSSHNISIPRYFFISKNGKIINSNLPRPSDFEFLVKVINSTMK